MRANQLQGLAFPTGFSISQNEKHWSIKEETLKHINQVISTMSKLGLPSHKTALIIWDVKGQITANVGET